MKLVCCGNDIGYLQGLKDFTKKKNLESEIIFLNFVKDEYLPYLYLDSSILVMPSLIGPTNIPPWEAFKMKKPVIQSNLKGIKDVLGDAVFYVDPINSNEIANSISKIISDTKLKEDLIKKGSIKLVENIKRNNFSVFFQIIKEYRSIQKLWNFDN